MKSNQLYLFHKTALIVCLCSIFMPVILTGQEEEKQIPDSFIVWKKTNPDGRESIGIKVPGMPPKGMKMPLAEPTESAVLLSNVPAYDWSFGCSATAAAMMAGYYDNNGYPNIYTGPANGGIAPLDNSGWGSVWINGEERKLCPLSATRLGLDSRTTRGHVDDYWVVSGHTGPDPYVTNGWVQHSYNDCTGDFMKTNQAAFGNSDGSTIFTFWVDGGAYGEPNEGDGCYGLKLFFESKECEVFSYYNQYILGYNGVTKGFTFEQYCDMIDRGRPVLIQVSGHTMLGMGYDISGSKVYLHDTWDYNLHEMTWGASYAGMQHYGVAVIEFPCDPFNDLSENFTYSSIPACWQQMVSGEVPSNRWSVAQTNVAGGEPNEMRSDWIEGIGVSRLVSAPVNASGLSSLTLIFKTFYDDYASGATLKIQSSADLINWTDEGWSYASGAGDISSGTIITVPITHNLVSATYLAWVIDGDHYQYDNWFVDDVSLAPVSSFDLKVFLQGPFNGTSMNTALNPAFIPHIQPYQSAPWNYCGTETVGLIPNSNVVDWILVELRETSGGASSATSGTVIGRRAGFLLSNGTITDLDGTSPLRFSNSINQNLYAVIWHRNHIGIMTAIPVIQTGGIYTYDFSSSADKVYSGIAGCKLLAPGIWGMMGGNGNMDWNTDNKDKNDTWDPNYGFPGYNNADFNMDGLVDTTDKNNIWKPVAGKGTMVP
jgi:hypothetical protein